MFEIPKPKVIDELLFINEKESLLNYSWLSGSIPWMNHDNECKRYTFYNIDSNTNQSVDVFLIKLNGLEPTITKITCDSVVVTGWHGTVTNYFFEFFNNGKSLSHSDFYSFAYSEEDVKKRFIEYSENKIKGLEWQINNQKTIIEKVNECNICK